MAIEGGRRPRSKGDRMLRSTQVYRHFAQDGTLLYIGTSLSTAARLCQHRDHSHWFKDIGRVEIQTFSDRPSALKAEKEAIREEQPIWNIRNKKPLPELLPLPSLRAEEAAHDLTQRVVTFEIAYSIEEVARLLGVQLKAIRGLIADGLLGTFEIPASREGWKPRVRISGWQLIDYLEAQTTDTKEEGTNQIANEKGAPKPKPERPS